MRTARYLWTPGIVALLCLMPLLILRWGFSPETGFLRLIRFSERFETRRFAEIDRLRPSVETFPGYDGQFYAQIALDPTLRREGFAEVLDGPLYRGRRIGLPLLAWCIGLGRGRAVLQAYALLNFVFWAVLLLLLGRRTRFRAPRDLLLAGAMLWSTGTLVSLARALTDLPAAVLGVASLCAGRGWFAGSLLLGVAAIFKETWALGFPSRAWPFEEGTFRPRRFVLSLVVMVLPLAAWLAYVHRVLPPGSGGGGNFAPPFAGLVSKFGDAIRALAVDFPGPSRAYAVQRIFEVLCPLSLSAQAAYLLARPRVSDRTWRLGIGFAVLMLLLGTDIWKEQYAYARILLPLTFVFNLLIHREESGARFAAWYLAGNLGMGWMILMTLGGNP